MNYRADAAAPPRLTRSRGTGKYMPVFSHLCLGASLVAVAGSLFAQVPPPPYECRSRRCPGEHRNAGAGTDMVQLQYPTATCRTSCALRTTDRKKLIMDNMVQGKVNISITKPIPRDEAIRIIEINLLMNKFSLVPAGRRSGEGAGKWANPRTAGVPIISEEELIPSGEQVVSFLFKLRFAIRSSCSRCYSSIYSQLSPTRRRCRCRKQAPFS
jgi:hypothetical protein